jgi:hypothetical protein
MIIVSTPSFSSAMMPGRLFPEGAQFVGPQPGGHLGGEPAHGDVDRAEEPVAVLEAGGTDVHPAHHRDHHAMVADDVSSPSLMARSPSPCRRG